MSSVEGPSPEKRKDNSKLKLKIRLTKSGKFVSVCDFDETDGHSFASQENKADKENPVWGEHEQPDEDRLSGRHCDAGQYSGYAGYDPRTKKKKARQQGRLAVESRQSPSSDENIFDEHGLTELGSSDYCQGRKQSLKVEHSPCGFSAGVTRTVDTKMTKPASPVSSDMIETHRLKAESNENASMLATQAEKMNRLLDTDVQQMALYHKDTSDASESSCDDMGGFQTAKPIPPSSDQTEKCSDAQIQFQPDPEHSVTARPCHGNEGSVLAAPDCGNVENHDLTSSSVLDRNVKKLDHSLDDSVEKYPGTGCSTESCNLEELASPKTVLYEDTYNILDDDCPKGLVIDLNDSEINNNSHLDGFPSSVWSQPEIVSEEGHVQKIENSHLEVLPTNVTGIIDGTRGSVVLASSGMSGTCDSQQWAEKQTRIDKPGPMFSKRCRCKNRIPQEFPDYILQSKPNWKHKMCGKCLKRIPIPQTKKQIAVPCEEHKLFKVYDEHNYSRAQCDDNRKTCTFSDKHDDLGTGCVINKGKPFARSSCVQENTTFRDPFTCVKSQHTEHLLTEAAADCWARTPPHSQIEKFETSTKRSLKKKKVNKIIHNDFAILDAFGLNPCYVVLERLKGTAGIGQSCVVKPPCPGHCRTECLEFLCEVGNLKHCKHSVLKSAASFEPETKRTAVFHPKRDVLRCNKSLEGYEEYRQQQLQTRMEKLKESVKDTDLKQTFDNASSSLGVFFPLSMLCAKGNTRVHIRDKEIKAEQGLPSEHILPSWSQPQEANAAAARLKSNTQSEKEKDEIPDSCVHTSARRSVYKFVAEDCTQDSSRHDYRLVSQKPHQSGSQTLGGLVDFGQEYPDDRRADRDQLKMSKFEVKYYVFEADGRAFVVPLIRTGVRASSPAVLDEEDLMYVKTVISLLLEENSSCARLLEYPLSLKHKQKSRSVSRSDTKEREKEKAKPFVVESASEFHLECRKMVASDPQVLNLVPGNPNVTPDEYLQQLGDEVFLYLSGGMEDAPPWIRELGKKIITKYKKRMQKRNRPKPSKDVTIEIDYAVEDDNIDVGEEEDLQEASAFGPDTSLLSQEPVNDQNKALLCPDPSLIPEAATAAYLQTYGTITMDAASTETSADNLVTQQGQSVAESAGQQTGSFVSEEVFMHEKKPSLADLLRLTHTHENIDWNHKDSFQGRHITVPLPSALDAAQTFGEQSADCSASDYAAQWISESVDQKPFCHELLPASMESASVLEKPFPAEGQPPAQTGGHACHPQHTSEHNSLFSYAVIKQEPPDDGYPYVSSGTGESFSQQQCPIKQEPYEYTEQQNTSFPFITASTFGPGVVELEKEVDCGQRDCVASSSSLLQPTISSLLSNSQPELRNISPWMVPEFDQESAVAGQERIDSREMPRTQTHFVGKHLWAVPASFSGREAVEHVDGHESESILSCELVNKLDGSVKLGDREVADFHATEADSTGRRAAVEETLPVITSVCGADTLTEFSEGSCPGEVEYACDSCDTENVPVISEVCGAGVLDSERQQGSELKEGTDSSDCAETINFEKFSFGDSVQISPAALNGKDDDSASLPIITEVRSTDWSEECEHELSKVKSWNDDKENESQLHNGDNDDTCFSPIAGEDSLAQCVANDLPIPSDCQSQQISIPLILPHADSASGNAGGEGNDVRRPAAADCVQQFAQGLGSMSIKHEHVGEDTEGNSDSQGIFPISVNSLGIYPMTVSGSSTSDLCHHDAPVTSKMCSSISAEELQTHTTAVVTSLALLNTEILSSSGIHSSKVALTSSADSCVRKKSKKRNRGWSGKPSTNKKRRRLGTEGKLAEHNGMRPSHCAGLPSVPVSDYHGKCSEDSQVPAASDVHEDSGASDVPAELTSLSDAQELSNTDNKCVQSPVIPTFEEETMFDSSDETDDEVNMLPVFSALQPDTGDVKTVGRSEDQDNCIVGSSSQSKEAVTNKPVSESEKQPTVCGRSGVTAQKYFCNAHAHESVSVDTLASAVFDGASSRLCNAITGSSSNPPSQDLEDEGENKLVPPAETESMPHENSGLEPNSVQPSSSTVTCTVTALASQVATVRMKKRRKPAKKGWGNKKKSRTRRAKKSSASSGYFDVQSDFHGKDSSLSSSCSVHEALPSDNRAPGQPDVMPSPPKRKKRGILELERPVILEKSQPDPSVLSADRVTANLNSFLAKLQKSRKSESVSGQDVVLAKKTHIKSSVGVQSSDGNLASGDALGGVAQNKGMNVSRLGTPRKGLHSRKCEPRPRSSASEGKGDSKLTERCVDKSSIEHNHQLGQSGSSGSRAEHSESSASKPRERSFFDCLPEDFLSAWKSS